MASLPHSWHSTAYRVRYRVWTENLIKKYRVRSRIRRIPHADRHEMPQCQAHREALQAHRQQRPIA